MKFKNPVLAVTDLEQSVEFYQKVLGLRKIADFGADVTLTGGVCLQTLDSWRTFLGTDRVEFGGGTGELYFEEEDFDAFAEKLESLSVQYVHPVKEHAWGQRVVRFYDPDRHIIEVGEELKAVCRRFLDSGMTLDQAAERMGIPPAYAARLTKEKRQGYRL